jgi:hypothetical protein
MSAKISPAMLAVIELVMQAAASPRGLSVMDLDEDSVQVHKAITIQRRKGLLFVAKISHKKTRYFDTQARADACVAVTPKPKSHGWGVVIKAGPRFDHSAPLIFTPKTKYTIAPTPPRALRSNTYLEFA